MSSPSIDWVAGLKVKITTVLDDTFVGKVYTYSPETSTLTLEEEPSTVESSDDATSSTTSANGTNYRVIKSTFIRDAVVVEKPKKNWVPAPMGYVSLKKANQRATKAVNDSIKEKSMKGKGVSPEAQEVFNTIYKTLPCRWYEKSIIVVDEVRIDPPYTSEACKAAPENEKSLDLVRKIVEGAWAKMDVKVKGG